LDLAYYKLTTGGKIAYKIKKFFRSICSGVGGFFKGVFLAIASFFRFIFSGIKNYSLNFYFGDGLTKTSYFLMGAGHIIRGQRTRGIVYLLIEIGFILYTVFFGGKYFAMFFENFFTGGNIGRVETSTSDIWDDNLGEYVTILGDNSFHIVLYGILTIFVIAFFIICYISSVSESYQLEQLSVIGKKPDTISKDLAHMLDSKFHITLLSLPMIGLFMFTVVPLITMILIAFTNYDAAHEVPSKLFQWVGFENFKQIFSSDSDLGKTFWRVLSWTLIWAVFATFTSYFGGMLLAMLINRKGIKLKKLYRTIFVATIAVPQFVSLLIMAKMLDTGGGTLGSGGGIITQMIESMFGYHLKFGIDIETTRILVILVNMWIGVPYSMLMCSGILMNIPADLYESARIDGASSFRRFMKITLPYMLFVTGPHLITSS
jgi:arabinogalactan oligomer/maltooligosaccharide transport system permease protein